MAGPPSEAERTLYQILTKVGTRLNELAKPRVEAVSQILADAMRMTVDVAGQETFLMIPHYWAVYLHDGRGPFRPRRRNVKFLVWFAAPADDPRLRSGYPVRETDIRILSKAQFQAGLEENKRRLLSGGSPYMFVAKAWPLSTPGTPFFTQGLEPVQDEIPDIVDTEIQKLWGTVAGDLNEKKTTTITLR